MLHNSGLVSLFGALLRTLIVCVTVLYFQRVLAPKRPYWQALLALGGVLLAFQAAYALWPPCDLFSSHARPLLSAAVMAFEAIAVIAVLRLLTASRWAEILLFYSLSLLISVAASLLSFGLSSLFNGERVSDLVATQWNDLFSSCISSVLQLGLLLTVAEAVSRLVKKQAAELRSSQFMPVFGAQAASAVLVAVLMRESGLYGRMLPALAVLLLLYGIADGVLIQSVRAFVRNGELTARLASLERQQAQQQRYYLSLGEQLKSAQRLRHDYRNTLQTLDTLIVRGETERALALAAECRSALAPGRFTVYTGNDVLDAVLNNKAEEAAALGVAFRVEMALPEPVSVSDMDLMSIFANLLDNALDYLRQLPAASERQLAVEGAVGAGLWALTFSNTYAGSAPPSFETVKPDRERHGHGVEIVRSILRKYDGTFMAKAAAGRLFITVTLNMAGEQTAGKENKA